MEAEKSIWEENIELWEKWSNDCQGTMFKAMETALQQSSSFRAEIDKATNAAISTQVGVALAAIKVLECQIEGLTTQVEELKALQRN
ncbi:MAG: hypothetical protein HY782_09935 [Chloroflexi bacterium]|nr:hypothetical protein [Chloroflexota bacterium]